MKKIVALLFIALAFSGCHEANPHDTVIPQSDAALQKKFLYKIKWLNAQDQKLLTAYLARVKKKAEPGHTGVPAGMTIRAAIAEQQKLVDQHASREKAEKERLEMERADKLRKPGDTVGIRVANIKVVTDEDLFAYQRLRCQLVVQNFGRRDISRIKGRVYFYDGDGREMAELALNIKQRLKGRSTTRMTWKQDYNPYSEEDRALAKLTTSEYKTVFIPETIVFANGKKLIMPE